MIMSSTMKTKPRAKFDQQELPTLTDDPVYVTEMDGQPIDVLYSEDLTTPIIPGKSTGNLKESPVQKEPVTGNTDHVIDQTAPHAGSPPLPEDRRETLYEKISETRECQEYVPLDEIFQSLTAHQHQRGHTVPKQVITIAKSIQVATV